MQTVWMGTAKEDRARRLRWARETCSQPDVANNASEAARRLNVPGPTYLAHENSTRGFKVDDALKYAVFYKVSPTWLLFNMGEPRPVAQSEIAHAILQLVSQVPEAEQEKYLNVAKVLLENKVA